jgi:sialic acid synthase SpsE
MKQLINPYLYTETAFHHEGDIDFLKQLISASKDAGVQAVKFQILIEVNEFLSSNHSAYEHLKKMVLSYQMWKSVLEYTASLGLDIIAMPLDKKSFNLFKEIPINFLELHSVQFYDEDVKKMMKETNIPLIIGTGGRTNSEIEDAIHYFGEQLQVLMYGFQSFPSTLDNVRLERIAHLKSLYPKLIIGYADHTDYKDSYNITANEYAYIMGARMFEKHITVSEGVKRTDYESAVSPQQIKMIVDRLQYLAQVIMPNYGETLFDFTEAELKYRNRQKKVVAAINIPERTIITSELVGMKMDDNQGGLNRVSEVLNHKASRIILKDELITLDNVH